MDLSLFMICLYDTVKPIKNLVSKIIVGCFIRFYVLYVACMKIKKKKKKKRKKEEEGCLAPLDIS